jgi:hypothetical protein
MGLTLQWVCLIIYFQPMFRWIAAIVVVIMVAFAVFQRKAGGILAVAINKSCADCRLTLKKSYLGIMPFRLTAEGVEFSEGKKEITRIEAKIERLSVPAAFSWR